MLYVPLKRELARVLSAASRHPPLAAACHGGDRMWTDADLVQLGFDLGLPLEQIALLCLKRQWEEFVHGDSGELDEFSPETLAWQRVKSRFQPDAALSQLFVQYGFFGKTQGDEESFAAMLREMILADLHLASCGDPEFLAFLKRRAARRRLFRMASPEEAEQLAILSTEWLQLNQDLNEVLLHREASKLAAARVTHEFLHLLPEFIEQERQAERERLLKQQVEHKESNKSLTREELRELVAAEERRSSQELDELGLLIAQPLPGELPGGESEHCLTAAEIVAYEEQSKQVLRQIQRLLHPDHLEHDAAFTKLTPRQKSELAYWCRRTLRIRPEELAHPRGSLGYTRRAIEVLEAIRQRVTKTLENAGIDTDLRFIEPDAATAAERAVWYREEIERLTREIARVRGELLAILEDPVIEERRFLVFEASPDEQEKERERMRRMSSEHSRRADALAAQLEALFHASPGDR